jgi:alpha-D-xyloside xylohydrolase
MALAVARRYAALQLPVGVLVVDYKNQKTDGDFAPDAKCFPSVKALASEVKTLLNASTVFSFWPEVQPAAQEHAVLNRTGCLINTALGGNVVDATPPRCRRLIWDTMVGPRYFEQGVDAFWLDETDGEGTGGGGDGDHGYDTAVGPAAAYSNLWVNQWLRLFSEPVQAAGVSPLVLTRGVWAGGAKYGAVLWSSDIWSSFEQLRSQVRSLGERVSGGGGWGHRLFP